MHSRAVSIEDPRDFDFEPMLAAIVRKNSVSAQRFPSSEHDRNPNRIDIAPVAFDLRMDHRIAVHLAGRRLKNAGIQAFWRALTRSFALTTARVSVVCTGSYW